MNDHDFVINSFMDDLRFVRSKTFTRILFVLFSRG